MNREKKLEFIKKVHPKLYKSLEEHVPGYLSNIWNASLENVNLYNAWVSIYCDELNDANLKNFLRI